MDNGMGIWHSLASEDLSRLLFCCSGFNTMPAEFDIVIIHFSKALFNESGGTDADEEGVEIDWDAEVIEKELGWGVVAPGGGGLAGLLTLGTYLVCMVLSQLSDSSSMCLNTWLVGFFTLDLFHHRSTTPQLSP